MKRLLTQLGANTRWSEFRDVALDIAAVLPAATPPPSPQPADYGLIGWAFDPVSHSGQSALSVAGRLQVVRIPIRAATTITNIVLSIVTTAGSGLTAGQCKAALYQNGVLLGTTADRATAWASVGTDIAAISGGPVAVAAGYVDVAFWYNGTTSPLFARGSATSAIVNAGLASAPVRFVSADTGVTTTAPSTLGAKSASTAYWAAVQ